MSKWIKKPSPPGIHDQEEDGNDANEDGLEHATNTAKENNAVEDNTGPQRSSFSEVDLATDFGRSSLPMMDQTSKFSVSEELQSGMVFVDYRNQEVSDDNKDREVSKDINKNQEVSEEDSAVTAEDTVRQFDNAT